MNPLLPPARLDARAIVRASGSSFLPAFRLLAPDRHADLMVLYAFCRLVDDLSDAGHHPAAERIEALEAWRCGFHDPSLGGLPDNLRELALRRSLDPQWFLELLDGTETDLAPEVTMPTRRDLDLYCHRVAGVVGRLCLPIFGADPGRAAQYAETLGRALQYTNILRDTFQDFELNRLYFPADELAAAGLDPRNFLHEHEARRSYLSAFAAAADGLFDRAALELPSEDRTALRPARVMGQIYRALLRKIRQGRFDADGERCRLTTWEKLAALTPVLAGRQ
jgi:phytoene/squalene synthetase